MLAHHLLLDNRHMSNINGQRPVIVLCTLNAKYIHASLGLRYLMANMRRYAGDDIAHATRMLEFTISRPVSDMVNDLLQFIGPDNKDQTQVLGFGVYIWNVIQTTELVRQLKTLRPQLQIILGGPEVSHETESQTIFQWADHVITGWGDVSFPKLCKALVEGPRPLMKIIQGEQPNLSEIELPYQQFSDEDLAHRVLYVEASRGCPFKCEFCLSSLDKTAWAFELNRFLEEMQILYSKGARNFKFVDRTFNLKIDASIQILQFFLERLKDNDAQALLVHFELIPDHLPDKLKALIQQFPPGVLQFEVGIQSFNVDVQERISRRQDNALTEANLRWLLSASNAHLHTDLIFGLPGETMESFAQGFDRLWAIGPQEIQLGILKRLRGTPIARHTLEHEMTYDSNPPYAVLQTKTIDAQSVMAFARMAKYWDLVANSGRFTHTLPLLLKSSNNPLSAFGSFMAFSNVLWDMFGKTFGITPEELVDAVFEHLTLNNFCQPEEVKSFLLKDYLASGARGRPKCLAEFRLPSGGEHSLGPTYRSRQDRHGDLDLETQS